MIYSMSDIPKPEVSESTEYDNFMDKLGKSRTEAPTLDGFLDEVHEAEDDDWREHWQDMPEFIQEDNKTHKTIYVHFRNEEDYQEFAQLIGQTLSKKTKSIWHPKLDRTANSLMRWIEDDE